MTIGTVFDRNAGLAAHQDQIIGFDKRTGIDSKSYGAPGAKIFYVDPNNPQAVDLGNLGEDPTVPLATVAAAIVLCRDHMGDTIVVGGNDAWTFAPGNRNTPIREQVVIPENRGGIRIVGVSSSPFGVSWHPTTDNGICLTVNAVDVQVEGFVFAAPLTTLNVAILCEWDGVTKYGDNLIVKNCVFYQIEVGIAFDFSWYCLIENCLFDSTSSVAIVNTSIAGDADYCTIARNQFVDCALAISMTTADNATVHQNVINGDGTGVNNFIDFAGGADNMVSDNWLACTIAQYDVTCSDATSGAWVRNHCIDGDTAANPV